MLLGVNMYTKFLRTFAIVPRAKEQIGWLVLKKLAIALLFSNNTDSLRR